MKVYLMYFIVIIIIISCFGEYMGFKCFVALLLLEMYSSTDRMLLNTIVHSPMTQCKIYSAKIILTEPMDIIYS